MTTPIRSSAARLPTGCSACSADVLDGNDGNDVVDGGEGSDTIDGDGGTDDLSGGDGTDTIRGGADSDIIKGNADADNLTGGLGDDQIDGGTGIDTVIFAGDFADYTITEDNVNGLLIVAGPDGTDTLRNVNRLQFDDQTITVVVPGITLTGGGGNNAINGGEGTDTLDGQGGDDTLNGFEEADSLLGGSGDDTLDGGSGNDALNGGGGADEIHAGSGDDTVDAGAGNDLVVGGDGAGNDSYTGGTGTDTVRYSSASQTIVVDLGNASATGADIDQDTLNGIENVIGGSGNDTITGNGLANLLDGGGGNDTLAGGAGKDVLIGGAGGDSFLFDTALSRSTKIDTIDDFNGIDTIQLENAIFTTAGELGVLRQRCLPHRRRGRRYRGPPRLQQRDRRADLRRQWKRARRRHPVRHARQEPRAHECGFRDCVARRANVGKAGVASEWFPIAASQERSGSNLALGRCGRGNPAGCYARPAGVPRPSLQLPEATPSSDQDDVVGELGVVVEPVVEHDARKSSPFLLRSMALSPPELLQ